MLIQSTTTVTNLGCRVTTEKHFDLRGFAVREEIILEGGDATVETNANMREVDRDGKLGKYDELAAC